MKQKRNIDYGMFLVLALVVATILWAGFDQDYMMITILLLLMSRD